MSGRSANERRRILADTGWAPYGRGLVREIRVLTEEPRTRGLGPVGEATYKSGGRKFPAQLHEELISLIYTPALANDPPHEVHAPWGIQTRVTTSHTKSSDLTSLFLR